MNRFTNYLESQKLAKILLVQAEQELEKGDVKKALRDALRANREFMTATNNIASLFFERRRKR